MKALPYQGKEENVLANSFNETALNHRWFGEYLLKVNAWYSLMMPQAHLSVNMNIEVYLEALQSI